MSRKQTDIHILQVIHSNNFPLKPRIIINGICLPIVGPMIGLSRSVLAIVNAKSLIKQIKRLVRYSRFQYMYGSRDELRVEIPGYPTQRTLILMRILFAF